MAKSFEELRDAILSRHDSAPSIFDESYEEKEDVEKEVILREEPKIKSKAKNISTDQIYKLMEMSGTTNKRIQEIMYESFVKKVGTDDKEKILEEAMNYYKTVRNK